MEIILIGVFVLQLLHYFLPVSAFPKRATESFVIHYLEDRRIIPVRIELNTNTQTEYVTSIAGETLYDFKQRKVAYKDLNSSQCFIMDIVEESLEEDRRRLKNLQNGVVRGFYLPTFIIKEELNNTTNLTGEFGILLTKFCTGNTVSIVVKQTLRKKRDISGDKEQFTHHSYGHYGHQSNNYAHYGHETYMKGTLDENGQIRNQQVNHQQTRSESSHVYPRPAHRNGIQDSSRSDASRPIYRNGQQDSSRSDASRPVYRNGQQSSTTDSKTGQYIPQTQYQTQHQMPSYQQTFGSGVRSPGIGGTGHFSLQSTHEGGYQLNLPLGLQGGNVYRGGVRSIGHYGVGGLQPRIATEHQQYPDSTLPSSYQQYDQRLPLPPVGRPSYPSILPGVSGADMRKIPSSIQSEIPAPAVSISDDRRMLPPAGLQTPDTQIPYTTSDRRQPGIDYETQLRKQVDHRTIPSVQITPSAEDRSAFSHTPMHPPSSISDTGHQITGKQPGFSSIYMPTRTIQSPQSIPGQISGRIPGSDISDIQRIPGISRPSEIHSSYPGLMPRQQHIPSGIMPGQQYLQTPDVLQPTGYRTNGVIQGIPASPSHISGIYPGYPSTTDAGKQQVTHASLPGSPAVPSIPYTTRSVPHETIRNGVRYPDAIRPETTITGDYPKSGAFPSMSRVPIDRQGTSVVRMHPGQTQLLPTGTRSISPETSRDRASASRPGETIYDSPYNLSIPSRVTTSEISVPTDGRIITGQTGLETSKIYDRNSASSQTQIQTAQEGTAAEASAAGHYRGLGSQTQVQGGYVGNGSFSAQAQSGFTGGVVQSQVQGGKQGGLSGSSAQVERVGSAESQVQILQPSGSASSTAQGRFTGGTTQVQAQSSKTGGSAGAQSQSTGLSNSHVQVNIGGNDVSREEHFQGTISAAVHGGQLSGQSQTQLQGGYNSGRTYAATAQGGFDTALEFQAAVPSVGSLTNFSGRSLQQPISAIRSQEYLGALGGDQRQISSVPVSKESSGITQHQALTPPVIQTEDSRAQYTSSAYQPPSLVSAYQPPSLVPSSKPIGSRIYPGYPAEDVDRRIPPISSGDFTGHRQFDERGGLTSGFPQTDAPKIPEQRTHFGVQIPETQDKTLYESGLQRPAAYPSLPAHMLTGTNDQRYLSRIPSSSPQLPGFSTYHPSQPSATIDSRYIPSSSTMPQISGLPEQSKLQTGYLPPSHFPGQSQILTPSSQIIPSHFPGQSQILTPSSQIIPSHTHPVDTQVLTRPDGSLYIEPPRHYQPMPGLTKIQPQQPQLLFPSSQAQPRPQIQPQYPLVSLPRPQIQPEQIPISQIQPQIRPEQPQISPQKPQISTTTEKSPVTIPPRTTEIKPDRVPGVSEPDKTDCCAALRDLKNRCCGRTPKQDEITPCCGSNRDDIFDFSSEDDMDENKQPCKVVKAICYIVYKPVGKARVCKPTETNRC